MKCLPVSLFRERGLGLECRSRNVLSKFIVKNVKKEKRLLTNGRFVMRAE